MTSAALYNSSLIDAPERMKTPFAVSIIFHGLVLLVAIFGLPYIAPDMPVMDNPVPVEIMTVAEMTQTLNNDARKTERKIENEQPKEEPPKPVAPTVTSATPPSPLAPEKPDPVKEISEPKKDDLAIPKKEEPKKEKPKKAPTPPKRPVLTQAENTQDEAFQSVLKNLMPDQAAAAEQSQGQQGEKPSFLASLGDQVTISEMEALQRQLAQCWNMMAGARYAEDLVVDIRMFVNPDRSVRDAQILDQFRYTADSYFRAAADSALRAIRNPYCNPLDLPPEKYDQWKVITVRFDPRAML